MDIRLNDKLAEVLTLLAKKNGTSAEEEAVTILEEYFFAPKMTCAGLPPPWIPHEAPKATSLAEDLMAFSQQAYSESPPPPQIPPSAPSRTPA